MAAASCLLSEDQFLCSICLDVFTDPVSTSCGHNFCKTCITEHWNINVQWKCPICKRSFPSKPELHINTFISEMVAQFREEAQQEANTNAEQQVAKAGEVPCDVCTGTRLKALKSCLVCLVSYCETHLEPHLTVPGLKRHQLIEPVENLEGRMCLKHDKPLELFCKTDQTCVCMLCTVLDHKMHDVVPLKEEYEGTKDGLEGEIQQLILKRQLSIEEIKRTISFSKESAEKEIGEGVRTFTILMQCVERGLDQFIYTIENNQKTMQKQAEDFIKKLEEEISELKGRGAELEQYSLYGDYRQSIPTATPPNKVWTEVSICSMSYEGSAVRAAAQLEETFSKQIAELLEGELQRVQQYAVDVILDPDTAHPSLIISDDGKQVNPGDVKGNVPDKPERFSVNPCILGKQSFCSGRFYFEVQVKGKTEWDLGVAGESINRKEDIPLSPEDGYWTIWRRRNKYKALNDTPVSLPLQYRPQKVGVFVDYEEGLVSFYDVDVPAHLYSFTGCCFTEKLFPYFNPGLNDGGKNSAPLILS